MSNRLNESLAYLEKHQARFIEELEQFVCIPSISTDPEAQAGLQQAAEWVADHLRFLGMKKVAIHPTKGQPVVYGESLEAGPDKPTVLIYGHYDVQPPDPLDLWQTPPFEPVLRDDYLYGRGTSDMKGQILVALKAVEALTYKGKLPINIKWMIEGEEEIGSPNLREFIDGHKELLACDFAVNPDTGMLGSQTPTITYGLRGLAYFEIRLIGPDHDLHSGLFGGAIHNPAQVLSELIAGMHDEGGRITLPGFYDAVRPLSEEERQELARLPIGEDFFLEQSGAPALYGEAGYTAVERVGARPTLEVNGLLSGFTGEGQKTVLPSRAMAKVSTRLVPDQDPDEVYRQLLRYLEANTPKTIKYELLKLSGAPPSITNIHLPGVHILGDALEVVWGVRPLYRREGGSVPVVFHLQEALGVESVCTGFSLPDDNLHSPNEKVHLPTIRRGMQALVHYFEMLGQ